MPLKQTTSGRRTASGKRSWDHNSWHTNASLLNHTLNAPRSWRQTRSTYVQLLCRHTADISYQPWRTSCGPTARIPDGRTDNDTRRSAFIGTTPKLIDPTPKLVDPTPKLVDHSRLRRAGLNFAPNRLVLGCPPVSDLWSPCNGAACRDTPGAAWDSCISSRGGRGTKPST